MAIKAKAISNAPPPRPVIIKKITVAGHAAHHGGAWKIAYADFVTAMMAFFLLMWLLGMTDEEKRKGLADYFAPTLIEYRQESAGSNGLLGGDSIIARENFPHGAAQTGSRSIVVPHDAAGGPRELTPNATATERRFVGISDDLERRIAAEPALRNASESVRLTMTPEGLRIDLMDRQNYSMFRLGTADMAPETRQLVRAVAASLRSSTNRLIVRGHTDSLQYANAGRGNNWTLSAERAEATRQVLENAGVSPVRIERIEGAADREPVVPGNSADPRNRRIAITIAR